MGFELSVAGRAPTPDLAQRWQTSLAAYGLLCEFHPDFSFGMWSGGFLPIKLSVVPNSFPLADRYGTDPVVCGFEFSEHANSDSHHPTEPPELFERLQDAIRLYEFRTAMGRNVGDLRLQCFGAAALAELTGGVVYDPQQGQYFFGAEAVANAAREADEYEADWARPDQWRLPKFAEVFRTEAEGTATELEVEP